MCVMVLWASSLSAALQATAVTITNRIFLGVTDKEKESGTV